MKKFIFILLLCLHFHQSSTQIGPTVLEKFIGPFRIARRFLTNIQIQSKKRNLSPERTKKFEKSIIELFPCELQNVRSSQKPDSVHRVRPGDIDVIAAMGDSLTAGVGITAIDMFELTLEERGKSFTIGGDGDWTKFTTLPNILKVFNPNLIGFSTGTSLSIDEASHLNVAEAGAISAEMPYMAKELIKRIKFNKSINTDEDWKMITIFIGANDFCSEICYLENANSSLEKHRSDMIEVLRSLRDNLPRTIVNLIPPPHIKILVELQVNSFCDLIHRYQCPCFFGVQFEHKRKELYGIMDQWQKIDEEIANLEEFDNDGFTVVIQPFILNYTFPTITPGFADERYFSVDCFHFSQKLHARAANDLWNNIMEPVGRKTSNGHYLFTKFNCPSEQNPYIFTKRNSRINLF